MQNQNYQNTYSSPANPGLNNLHVNPATQPITTTTYIQDQNAFPTTTYTTPVAGQTFNNPAAPTFVSQTGVFGQQSTFVQPNSTFVQQPYTTSYNGNTMIPAQGHGLPQQGGDVALGKTAVAELELKKRLLDNSHETQMKYADMESDKQHKLEDKAEKQREKAAKWKGRHQEWLVHSHEKKAVKLEEKAHSHQMLSEDYKTQAKAIETERKQYDPPSDKKDDKKPGDKKDAKKDDKKDDKKDSSSDKKPADASKKDAPADATKKDMPAPPQTSDSVKSDVPTSQHSTADDEVNRPKKAVAVEKRDPEAKFQQDVSTAAIKYAQGVQAQQSTSTVPVGVSKQ